ncbi:MAG: porin family protein [Bacteroidia bacterium]|nr:porin family protein [Bacteroidia bacterium]
MRRLLLTLFLIYSLPVLAQKGEVQLRAGLGAAVYSTESEVSFSFTLAGLPFSIVQKEEDNAVAVHIPLEFRYGLSNRWNLGLDFKFGSYLYDPDSAAGKSNAFMAIGPQLEYNLVNKESFRWYLGLGFNYAILKLEDNMDEVPPMRYNRNYSGSGVRINTGIIWFFTTPLGLHFNAAFDSHDFQLNEYRINDDKISLDNLKGSLYIIGADIFAGLVLRF